MQKQTLSQRISFIWIAISGIGIYFAFDSTLLEYNEEYLYINKRNDIQ